MGPVRRGNQAFEHAQHDVYGEVILATTQAFFDRRLLRPANEDMFRRLEPLGEQAVRLYDQPDAGLWELRTKAQIHTMSSAMAGPRAIAWPSSPGISGLPSAPGTGGLSRHPRPHRARLEPENQQLRRRDGDIIDAMLLAGTNY